MCAPLRDFKGNVRYFLGAQVDVSGLAIDFTGLDYLENAAYGTQQSRKKHNSGTSNENHDSADLPHRGLKKFSEMLNNEELEVVRKNGGRMYRPDMDKVAARDKRRLVIVPEELDRIETDAMSELSHQGSLSRQDDESNLNAHNLSIATTSGGQLGRVYEHYVLVRPAPSLRILFASPSLRIPGLLQSSLLDRIGGPARIRQQVIQALVKGQSVTASMFPILKGTCIETSLIKAVHTIEHIVVDRGIAA